MSEVVIRAWEGEPIEAGLVIKRIIGTYDEPWGTGTATRRCYVLICDKPIELLSKACPPATEAQPNHYVQNLKDVQ